MRGPRHRTSAAGDHDRRLPRRGRRARAALPLTRRRRRETQLTYAELALDVERVACGLLALDIAKGDRIAIWAPESTEWALVQLAAARAGAVLVILDGDWTTEQLLAVFREAKVGCCVAAGAERVALLAAVRESSWTCSSGS